MKQPKLGLEDIFVASTYDSGDKKPAYYCCLTDDFESIEISIARSEKAAYRMAARQLQKLARECERMGK